MSTVSVIVPVFNAAAYLRAALDSLLAQSVGEWTAICVDDGSTDGSGAILDEYAVRDARFVVVHQANRGVSAARNAAIERATGEVLVFLDADDVVAPDWLKNLREGIAGVDLAWGGLMMDVSGELSYSGPKDVGAVYSGDTVRKRVWRAVFGYRLRDLAGFLRTGGLWRHCGREFGVMMCRALRRSVVGDLRFDERARLNEDAYFLSAFALRARSMRVLGDVGYHYFVRESGAMRTELREHMTLSKFVGRDIRREIDPHMSHWRGTFLLSAVDILRRSGPGAFLRYVWRRDGDRSGGE